MYAVAPAFHHVDSYITNSPFNINRIYDKDKILNGKKISNKLIYNYDNSLLEIKNIIIKSPWEILPSIVKTILEINPNINIIIEDSFNKLIDTPSNKKIINIEVDSI